MIIATCLINDTKCYSDKTKENVILIGNALLKKIKLDDTLNRLDALGNVSFIYDNPIDVHDRKREMEKKETIE